VGIDAPVHLVSKKGKLIIKLNDEKAAHKY
jgi:hypothetical protein